MLSQKRKEELAQTLEEDLDYHVGKFVDIQNATDMSSLTQEEKDFLTDSCFPNVKITFK